ncbi:hypothetical protein BDV18DRAFT_155955 [Aspergillus unguis]
MASKMDRMPSPEFASYDLHPAYNSRTLSPIAPPFVPHGHPQQTENPPRRNIQDPEETRQAAHPVNPPDTSTTPPRHRKCDVCHEKTHPKNMTRLPCRHRYCWTCIRHIIEHSVKDHSLFPPRCCAPITMKMVHSLIPPDLAKQFARKMAEHRTPHKMYCHVATCSAFIYPAFIQEGMAVCPECGAATCVDCTKKAHGGSKCQADPETQRVLDIAKWNGWQRCWSCRRVVERIEGCSSMLCLCGASFCYNCGKNDRGGWCGCAYGGGMRQGAYREEVMHAMVRMDQQAGRFA